MKHFLIGNFALLLVFGVAQAGAPEGKTLFGSKCQPCHGPNGEGKPAIAKMLNATMHPLGSKEVQAKPDADLRKMMTAGGGKMKPVTGLTDQQADDIVAFIRTLKQ